MQRMVVVLVTLCLVTGCSQGQPSADAPATVLAEEMPDAATSTIGPDVATDSGAVVGLRLANGLHVYRGIPYSAAPVGDLRWRGRQA